MLTPTILKIAAFLFSYLILSQIYAEENSLLYGFPHLGKKNKMIAYF
jgi:hypothetical protein